MGEEHVQELADEGHVIASHTWSHRILSVLSPAQKRSELARSKRYLEGLIEGPVDTIVYPYGGRNDVDDEAISLSRACGYRRGLMNVPDLQDADEMRIPRFSIPDTTKAPYIDAVLSGLKDTLRGAVRRRNGA
jgi:peptidoglycan/xylan/chitin deacetylase (PgdA/CDA1 family)